MKYEAVELRTTKDFDTVILTLHGVGIEELEKISKKHEVSIETLSESKTRYLTINVADVNLTFFE